MNRELAEHISLMAAPIYAAMLAPWIAAGVEVNAERLALLRQAATHQAHALWLDTLDFPHT